MTIIRPVLLVYLLSLGLSGCSDGSDSPGAEDGKAILDFDSYTWSEVYPGGAWEARAGLQTVALDDRFFLMGGRTPNPPMMPFPIPGDSKIWSDVWISDDRGETWNNILQTGLDTHWPPRAYFKAVVAGNFIYVLGGQDYTVVPVDCPPFLPPGTCPPFASESQFFNDVWRSADGVNWEQMTSSAGWSPRAGLSATVLADEIYVLGGSVNDDSAIIGGPPERIYYNDVWKSSDGRNWQQLTEAAPWAKRAGAELVTSGEYIYVLGGEQGFLCEPEPDCELPYYNDVWRSKDGITWEMVTETAGWSPRPGHQCGVIREQFVCFGGFGLPENPVDVWTSEDGAQWQLLTAPPWDARSGEDIKYDFDIIVTDPDGESGRPAIFTFGGDRETFEFDDPLNYLRIDDDVWVFTLPDQ